MSMPVLNQRGPANNDIWTALKKVLTFPFLMNKMACKDVITL